MSTRPRAIIYIHDEQTEQLNSYKYYSVPAKVSVGAQELCESRGAVLGPPSLTVLMVSVDAKQHCKKKRFLSVQIIYETENRNQRDGDLGWRVGGEGWG